MRQFLGNMSWSFYSGVIALPLMMIVSTLAGRYMGPAEFGKYNLIVLFSSYVLIFVFFGLDIASVKAIVKAKSDDDKSKEFFSSFVFTLGTLGLLIIIGLLCKNLIISKFGLDQKFVWLTIIYCIAISIKNILDVAIRGLERFKDQAKAKILEALTQVGLFVGALFLIKKISYSLFVEIIIIAAVGLIIFYLTKTAKYFKNFSLLSLKRQLLEGRLFMICSLLGTIFLSSDRLLIAKYINLETLGVYSAYYSGSLTLTSALSAMLTNVLLPATAKSQDKSFISKLDSILIKGFAPIFVLICLMLVVFMLIFGRAYPLRADYFLLFAFASVVFFFSNMFNTVILDADRKSYIRYLILVNIVNLFTLAYYVVLMKYISKSIDLILVGYLANLLINFTIQRFFVTKMKNSSRENLLVK